MHASLLASLLLLTPSAPASVAQAGQEPDPLDPLAGAAPVIPALPSAAERKIAAEPPRTRSLQVNPGNGWFGLWQVEGTAVLFKHLGLTASLDYFNGGWREARVDGFGASAGFIVFLSRPMRGLYLHPRLAYVRTRREGDGIRNVDSKGIDGHYWSTETYSVVACSIGYSLLVDDRWLVKLGLGLSTEWNVQSDVWLPNAPRYGYSVSGVLTDFALGYAW